MRHRAASAAADSRDLVRPTTRPRRPAAHLLQRAAGATCRCWRFDLDKERAICARRCSARKCAGHLRDPRRVVSACPCAGLSPGAVSRPARRGLCDAGDLRLPMPRGSTTWWHRVAAPRRARPDRGAGPERGQRPDRARVYRHSVPGRYVGPRAPRRDQGRGRPARRPRAARQPALRRANLRQTPRFIYEKVYCARGDIENRIKELLDGLQIDRTSCCRFWAINCACSSPAAYAMRTPAARGAHRLCPRPSDVADDRLLKLGAHVVGSVRRVVLHLPTATPDLHAWRIALALGAAPDRPQTAPVSRAYTHPNGAPSPRVAKPSLDGPIPRPSAPTISAIRLRRPARPVRDDHTVREADSGPSVESRGGA